MKAQARRQGPHNCLPRASPPVPWHHEVTAPEAALRHTRHKLLRTIEITAVPAVGDCPPASDHPGIEVSRACMADRHNTAITVDVLLLCS